MIIYNPFPICAQPFIFYAEFYSAFYGEAIQNVQCAKNVMLENRKLKNFKNYDIYNWFLDTTV